LGTKNSTFGVKFLKLKVVLQPYLRMCTKSSENDLKRGQDGKTSG